VSLSEIETFLCENNLGEIEFTKTAEAKEYRETLAKQKMKEGPAVVTHEEFPMSLSI
jgi:hypothetical protein